MKILTCSSASTRLPSEHQLGMNPGAGSVLSDGEGLVQVLLRRRNLLGDAVVDLRLHMHTRLEDLAFLDLL